MLEWNSKNAKKDLEIVKSIFDNLGVRFLLVYGTCLGAVRDKDFIDTDDDIDLAVIDEMSLKTRIQIGRDMEAVGFKTQGIGWYIHDVSKRIATDKEGWRIQEYGYMGNEKTGIIVMGRYVKITIFFFTKKGQEMLCIPAEGAFPVQGSPAKFYEKPDTIKFLGNTYFVPSPVGEYLEHTYSNWREPSREHGKLWVQERTQKEIDEYIASTFGSFSQDSGADGI